MERALPSRQVGAEAMVTRRSQWAASGLVAVVAVAVLGAAPAVGAPANSAGGVRYAATPPPARIPVERIAGADRIGTSVAVSQLTFPTGGTASAVVLARSDDFPDALTGGPLAAHFHAPVLLTTPTALSSETSAELLRVLSPGKTVYLLGGPFALGPGVESAVEGLGYQVQRISGATRYATAAAIADVLGNPRTVFEATGLNYPDALAGVPAAIMTSAAILLTDGSVQAPETAQYLAAHLPATRYALGGEAEAADRTAIGIAGPDRFATAIAVDARFFPAPATIGAAAGGAFADGLAAGPRASPRPRCRPISPASTARPSPAMCSGGPWPSALTRSSGWPVWPDGGALR
jgi:hypothetical protein